MHSNGVAHRDLKPENIIITPDYQIKLIDLGYGIPLEGRDGSYLLHTNLGTPLYKAPEILERRPYRGKDVDIFAFGIMLFSLRMMDYPFKTSDKRKDLNY